MLSKSAWLDQARICLMGSGWGCIWSWEGCHSRRGVAALLVVMASLCWLPRLFWLKRRCAVCSQLERSRLRITRAC